VQENPKVEDINEDSLQTLGGLKNNETMVNINPVYLTLIS